MFFMPYINHIFNEEQFKIENVTEIFNKSIKMNITSQKVKDPKLVPTYMQKNWQMWDKLRYGRSTLYIYGLELVKTISMKPT